MIDIRFVSDDVEKLQKLKKDLHEALIGSPGYINSEIAICDETEPDFKDINFHLIIGNDNKNNKRYFLNIDGENDDVFFEETGA